MRYLRERRAALGGYAARAGADARRRCRSRRSSAMRSSRSQADGKEMSTTMAFVRLLGNLLKDKALGPRIVPIVADEARTFGMANLFRQVGIYSPRGPALRARGRGLDAVYREARDGQLLEEGITEAGAHRSAGPRPPPVYSVHGLPMLPFYIYYSMFGFQRVGDLIWAAADQRARGFLLGATAGPHDARRRGPAAPGRQQPRGRRHRSRTAAPTTRPSRARWR